MRGSVHHICCIIMLVCSTCACVRNRTIHDTKRVIVIQPFADFATSLSQRVLRQVKVLHPNTILKKPMAFPPNCFNQARQRYRADSLIRYLSRLATDDTVIIAVTDKDISTSKGVHADWGIMGLAFCPGKACIVSTFRLKNANLYDQFYKVAIHELGHTQGLPHCKVKNCFMRDAEGGNPLNEETGFCASCKSFLIQKKWQFN